MRCCAVYATIRSFGMKAKLPDNAILCSVFPTLPPFVEVLSSFIFLSMSIHDSIQLIFYLAQILVGVLLEGILVQTRVAGLYSY